VVGRGEEGGENSGGGWKGGDGWCSCSITSSLHIPGKQNHLKFGKLNNVNIRGHAKTVQQPNTISEIGHFLEIVGNL
jgi:hypothetical protein